MSVWRLSVKNNILNIWTRLKCHSQSHMIVYGCCQTLWAAGFGPDCIKKGLQVLCSFVFSFFFLILVEPFSVCLPLLATRITSSLKSFNFKKFIQQVNIFSLGGKQHNKEPACSLKQCSEELFFKPAVLQNVSSSVFPALLLQAWNAFSATSVLFGRSIWNPVDVRLSCGECLNKETWYMGRNATSCWQENRVSRQHGDVLLQIDKKG